jgi:hypothetical protein
VRLNPDAIRLETAAGELFPLLQRLSGLTRTGQVRSWPVQVALDGAAPLPVRLCVVRKSKAAIARALAKLRRKAQQGKSALHRPR